MFFLSFYKAVHTCLNFSTLSFETISKPTLYLISKVPFVIGTVLDSCKISQVQIYFIYNLLYPA